MPTYSTTPYGIKPNTGPKFPANAQPISTAPQATARPIWVYEQSGRRHPALFYKGQWQRGCACYFWTTVIRCPFWTARPLALAPPVFGERCHRGLAAGLARDTPRRRLSRRDRAGRKPMRFKSRREARDWCAKHHPGSPIEEIGRGGKQKQWPKTARWQARSKQEGWQGGPYQRATPVVYPFALNG